MRPPAVASIVALAMGLACAKGTSPTFSTDFQPGGGIDVPAAGDEETPPRDVPGDDAVVAVDAGTDVPVGTDLPVPQDVPVGSDLGPDASPVDTVVPGCGDGAIRGVSCGLNDRGVLPQNCVDGQWVDGGECVDPDLCRDGDTQSKACGLNGRGSAEDDCVAGQWVPDGCRDPDVCVDGSKETVSCGTNGGGTQARECVAGAWATGGCIQPGRWDCQANVCAPVFGDPACGNGACEPWSGESRNSCPADCGFGGLAGEGQPCDDAMDCAFYDWPASGPGYWECRGLFNRTCAAVKTNQYCGTQGYDWCYLDPSGVETDRSCPQDCKPQYLNCGSDAECIYLDWPVP